MPMKQRRFLKFQPAHDFWYLDGTCFGGFMYLKKIPAGDFLQSLLTSRSFVWESQSLPKKSNKPKSRLWGAFGGFSFLIL